MIHFHAKRPFRKIGLNHRAMQVLGAEMLRLFLDIFDQHRAVDAFGEAGKVLDQRGERELSARFVPGDDQGFQIRARGIDMAGFSAQPEPMMTTLCMEIFSC